MPWREERRNELLQHHHHFGDDRQPSSANIDRPIDLVRDCLIEPSATLVEPPANVSASPTDPYPLKRQRDSSDRRTFPSPYLDDRVDAIPSGGDDLFVFIAEQSDANAQ